MALKTSQTDPGIERLLAVTRAITGELDLDRLLRKILVSAVEVTGAERGCLMTGPVGPRIFEKTLYHRMDAAELESEAFRPSWTLIQEVCSRREGIRVSDALECPLTSQSVQLQGLRSVLCEPLLFRGELVGLLYLDCSRICDLFCPEHHELLSALAAQAAICMENARFFAQVQEATRRRLEEEVRAQEMEARRDLMSAFVSIAAHDLKNSLATLKGGVYVLQRMALAEPGPDLLAAMGQSIQQAIRLVRNYLEFARMDLDEDPQLDLHRVRLAPLVERELEVVKARLSEAESARFQLEVDVPADLNIEADESRLEQILSNLIDNAVKYSPSGGRIRVRAVPWGPGLALEIRDSGVGIRPEDLEHLFERFTRLPEMSRKIRGTGLGLWITRRLVELHGWSIQVESEFGRGTTFRILLPEGPASDPQEAREPV